ncbi:hypothetical protein CSKR_103704 [Clonorchis sinensis]|uniref:Uncharacterized protein n=1 Tax=Clonorchis sinensis TaxID=79923 RepID=A0A419PKJ1_CLOSI|nr:hypothetical protein CSKR_103704 [Clonorchis sinensis]
MHIFNKPQQILLCRYRESYKMRRYDNQPEDKSQFTPPQIRYLHRVKGNKYGDWLSHTVGNGSTFLVSSLLSRHPKSSWISPFKLGSFLALLFYLPQVPSRLTAVRQTELAHVTTPSSLTVCDEFENPSPTCGEFPQYSD